MYSNSYNGYSNYPYGNYQNYSMPNFGNFAQPNQMPPQGQQPNQPQQAPPPLLTNIEYVNGMEGVKAIILQPNCTKLLLDSDSNCFYIKATDMQGKATIKAFDYVEHTDKPPAEYVTKEQFENFKNEIISKVNNNTQKQGAVQIKKEVRE